MNSLGRRQRPEKTCHCTPMPLIMYVANRGNTAPQMDRRKVLAAMADAANIRYASTVGNQYAG